MVSTISTAVLRLLKQLVVVGTAWMDARVRMMLPMLDSNSIVTTMTKIHGHVT
jgi:hypothetical protein